ncbi:MAG: hypothetical protein JWO28_3070 [Hyphomicrobiales bacterium]|jgi:hypothetical protein|nr:hypothetical protein [Hyphomicrobiales bacterium]
MPPLIGEGDTSHRIAQLEERIEELTASIERCRKISLAAKLAVGAGALWFVLFLLWILPFGPTAFVAATSAVLGGFVLLGSNATTWEQTEAHRSKAEAMRADLIGSMELRLVGDAPPTIH